MENYLVLMGYSDPNVYLGWEAKVEKIFIIYEVKEEKLHPLISIQDKALPNVGRTSAEEELGIKQSIMMFFLLVFLQDKMLVNKLVSL